jgi:hypothetical protein
VTRCAPAGGGCQLPLRPRSSSKSETALAVRCDSLRTGQLRPAAAVQTAGIDGRRRAAYLGIARVPDGGSESRASGENRVPEVDPGDCLRPSALLVAHERSATDEWPSAVPADDCFATIAITRSLRASPLLACKADTPGRSP